MIEINLLPEEYRKKDTQAKRMDLAKFNVQNLPLFKIAGAALAVMVAVPVLLFFIGLYARAHLSSTEKRYNQMVPAKKEADALKSEIEMVNKKTKAIDELMVKRFIWARKLNDLSDSVTPGIWLTELSYSEKLTDRPAVIGIKNLKNKGQNEPAKIVMEKVMMKYLIISGYASGMGEDGTAAVGKFIKSLKDSSAFYSDFSGIELGAIKTDRNEDQEVMSFKITCMFKEMK